LWDPNNALLYLALGQTYEEIGRHRELFGSEPTANYQLALESLDQAVERNPSLVDAMASRGIVRVRLSRFPHQDTEKLWSEAFTDFDKGLKINSRNTLSLLGVAFLNVCEADAAIVNGRPAADKLNSAFQVLARAQDTSPNHPDALFYRGMVYFHRKQFSRSKLDFLNCIQVHAGYRRWVEPWIKMIPE
jgi:tetratricopeptide (TPR) repeat protein